MGCGCYESVVFQVALRSGITLESNAVLSQFQYDWAKSIIIMQYFDWIQESRLLYI